MSVQPGCEPIRCPVPPAPPDDLVNLATTRRAFWPQRFAPGLLAAYLTQAREADQAHVLVLAFGGYTALSRLPAALQPHRRAEGDTIIEIWNLALTDIPPVRHLAVESLMAALDRTGKAEAGWRDYLGERYGA